MVDLPDPGLAVINASSRNTFRMELIDLIVILSSEGEVHWRSGLIVLLVDPEVVVHAVGGIANQCVRHKVLTLVTERRKSRIVKSEDIIKGCSRREEAEMVEHIDGGI